MLRRSALKPRHKNSGRQHDGKRFPSHLAWLRKRACVLDGKPGHICQGRMEAMHVDAAGGKGIGLKVPDYCAVPGCSEAHRLYHDHGAESWQLAWGVDLDKAWRLYASFSPHKHLWESLDA